MGEEYRIYGPPGTGKTTLIVKELIPEKIKKYSSKKIMITSFTRTAALNIAQRAKQESINNQIPDNMIGTLHSICFHALKMPKMFVQYIPDWNKKYPGLQLSTKKALLEENEISTSKTGDHLYHMIENKRAKMIPEQNWSKQLRQFNEKLKAFKKEKKCIDFTDLIDTAINTLPIAPFNPAVIIADEVQDFTPLQIALLRSWKLMLSELIMVGDEDQCIYSFGGTDPKSFLSPKLSDDKIRILNQSYRVPIKIHKLATKFTKKIKDRIPKNYNPTSVQGKITRGTGNYADTNWAMKRTVKHLENNQNIMFAASCSFMLDNIKKDLYQKHIPFSNPYRTSRTDWNPLLPKRTNRAIINIFLNFLYAKENDIYWTLQQAFNWLLYMKDNVFIDNDSKTFKAVFEQYKKDENNFIKQQSSEDLCKDFIKPHHLDSALKRDTDWLLKNMVEEKAKIKGLNYIQKIYQKYGLKYFQSSAPVHIGTIHSFKGAETDVCFLYPDISKTGAEYKNTNKKNLDEFYRLFYVAITRTKQQLYIMNPVKNNHFIEI